MSIENIEAAIRDIVDFPKPGIIFKDITPLLKSKDLFREIIDLMCEPYKDNPPDYFIGIEARGFIFASAMAYKMGCGTILVRKKGKLPYKTYEKSYALEYGSATIEMHIDSIDPGEKVVIVDDLLATGGTASATVKLVEKFDAEILGVDFLIELVFLSGREEFGEYSINSLIKVS